MSRAHATIAVIWVVYSYSVLVIAIAFYLGTTMNMLLEHSCSTDDAAFNATMRHNTRDAGTAAQRAEAKEAAKTPIRYWGLIDRSAVT